MSERLNVVVTGSTRGIGKGLAAEILKRGHNVVVSGRTAQAVDAAIAESGSLVVSTRGRIRNAWITPPVHIAIVRASQVLADLVDLFERDHESLDAASTTIITGPSKTADIEGVLVTGVHGPGEVVVVLVDG